MGEPALVREPCLGGDEALLPPERAARLSEVFKALSDPARIRLLDHIASSAEGTACACHLPSALGIGQPTMSHHMKRLTEAGLVTREQRGRWAHYMVVPEALALARSFLGQAEAGARPR